MKKILLFILLMLNAFAFSQTKNAVLSNGVWYKFTIDKTGVFKIDANFLRNLGINTNNLNPKNIKLYGNGGKMLPELASQFRYDDLQENAIFVAGEDDESFDNNDYILFYGVGPHSTLYNTTTETISHAQNIYTEKSTYFITIGNTSGKRISQHTSPSGSSSVVINQYDDFSFYEKEEVNILGVGRLWFGESFNIENNQTFEFPFDNFVPNSDLRIKVKAACQSSTFSVMNVTANGTTIPELRFNPVSTSTSTGLVQGDFSIGSAKAANPTIININYNNNGNPSARSFLDYIEIQGKKQLLANTKQFSFRSFEEFNNAGIISYSIENASTIFNVWDVSDPISPQNILNDATTGNAFSFQTTGGTLKEYIVLNENDFYTPEINDQTVVDNQNLHSLSNIQYLIITSKELLNEANRLANYHKENSGLTVQTVDVNKIYNEFSSGNPDIVGIRDFIKYIKDNSSSKPLEFVCFFGDSSYDYKDRINGNNNIVPTFHAAASFDLVNSYVTDDFFVMTDDSDGLMSASDTIDLTSGRIPVSSTQEANTVVSKILSYYASESLGDWRNTLTLVADDIDENSDRTLQSGLEEVADEIKINKPIFNVNKIYADAFKQENSSGGERYPQVKSAITNAIEKGTLVFDYFGHGGEDGLALERILEIPQIQSFNNFKTLPLFITVTCEFSRFDNPLRDTAGEQLFLNSNGGAVSMITTTRDVFISTGEEFNKRLTRYVLDFDNADDTIAKNLIKTKNETTSNQRFFIYFFGDPAMKLAIPKPNVQIDRLNGVDISQPTDTLKALSKIQLEGSVTDTSGTLLNNFNGTVFATIFDKPIDKVTLDNDNFGIVNTFDSQESKIFRGKSSVQNGRFNLEFIVPKDIKIAYGKGKVSLYADNNQTDKSGVNLDITVGGINENAPEDTTGPEIQPFMNDESFIEGGTTNTSPNLIIKLSDISGINTSITAVDHDIVAILDGNQSEPIILNDFYETELDDFTNGKVNYQLRDLSPGLHTLKIKAWDTYNNSSETTLTFEVISDTKLVLENVLNYPNPFTTYTEFWFNHNKPNELLEVQVQVFTISGKLVKTINETVQTTGGLSRSITWNGLDDFGNKIGKGVYVYKLRVVSTANNLSTEKYEKLVILQ